jgi:hypothetical protein
MKLFTVYFLIASYVLPKGIVFRDAPRSDVERQNQQGVGGAPQSIRIRLVNGRNGKPEKGERLNVWIDRAVGSTSLSTASDGIMTIVVKPTSILSVATNLYFDCRPFNSTRPSDTKYSIAEVLAVGVVTPNACGKIQMNPVPGDFIFFVRPIPWWERLRHFKDY